MTARPETVYADASEVGPCEIILVSTKNPALDTVIESLAGHVDEGTIIVPLMNGVRAYGRLQEAFPQTMDTSQSLTASMSRYFRGLRRATTHVNSL